MAGITEDLQREIDAWCSGSFIKTPPIYIETKSLEAYMLQQPLMTYTVDPQQEEIANLKGELESARYEAAQARRLAALAKAERDAAYMERDMALKALIGFMEQFINADLPAPTKEDPAVRAVRVMQDIGAAR